MVRRSDNERPLSLMPTTAMTKIAASADQRCGRLMSPLVVEAARPMESTRTAGAHGQRVVMSGEGGGATMDEAHRAWTGLQ